MVVFYKNDRTDVGKLTQEEDEAREWVPKVGRKNPAEFLLLQLKM